nr:hypothetical protein [Brevibacillus laterosporus]
MNIPKSNLLDGITKSTGEILKNHDSLIKALEERNKEENEWKQRVLIASEKTAENTSFIFDALVLIREGNQKQDEIFDLLVEMLSIAKSQTKEEAESKFTKVMRKINNLSTTAESIEKLTKHANTIWNVVDNFL